MIVVVLGMHRSGTSALSGLLHSNGICMGKEEDFYPPPMKENKKGFFENVKFRRINDAILHHAGYKVKSFDPQIPRIPIIEDEFVRSKMKKLIMDYQEKYKIWGWKDPRTSLTFFSWMSVMEELDIIDNVHCILMLRPPDQIAHSMRARGNKEKVDGQFEMLSMTYNVNAFCALNTIMSKGIYLPVLPVSFDSLINNTQEMAKIITRFLGHHIYETSFIDPDISRSGT